MPSGVFFYLFIYMLLSRIQNLFIYLQLCFYEGFIIHIPNLFIYKYVTLVNLEFIYLLFCY